jgi:hypothetical protein
MPAAKGFGGLRDPEFQRLRAFMMVQFKVKTGASIKKVAEEFGVSETTVERVLSFAKKAGLVAQMEDQILQELLPAAKTAIKRGLEDEDNPIEAAKIGMDLMKSLVPSMKKSNPTAKATSGESDLASYIAQLRSTDEPNGNVLDGEVIVPALGALEAGPASSAPQGDDESAGGDADGQRAESTEPESLGPGVSQRTGQDVEGV